MLKLIRINRVVSRIGESSLNRSKCINNYPVISAEILSKNKCVPQRFMFCTNAKVEAEPAIFESSADIYGLNKYVNVEELIAGDPELEKKLRVLILEMDVMTQEGCKIPDTLFMRTQHWKELLVKTTRSQRKKYLEFIWKIERKKENIQAKKETARIERESRPDYVDDGHIRYGLNHNTFLIRIYDSTINQMYNARLISAMQYGQPLVIDCGYDKQMTSRECLNCAKQIMLAFSENRFHQDPFDLHLCNAINDNAVISKLNGYIATLNEPSFPLHVHQQSYLETKFPSMPYMTNNSSREESQQIKTDLKDRIVYLTPHCREELTQYDHDAIYILGGIVDKINQEPLSLAKAKREGLRMAKLPLDRYLQWGGGSGKSLTLNQMISILLDIKTTGDWDFALRHVPRRKILGVNAYSSAKYIADNVERQASSFDRSSAYRHGNKRANNNWKTSNRNYDNMREKGNPKTNTKDLINKLMQR